MTDSLARVLTLFADDKVKREFVPRLTATSVEVLAQGAQFLTEKDGGSDVGTTGTIAWREPDGWRLYGDKWFCSNAGAELMLTLARPEGAPVGTKGLGLFLVAAHLPDGTRNRFRINRLKEKLGSRSMASGEYTFDGALAHQIGPLDCGFRQMMEMVNASRLSNAMRATAMMRRSYYEALVHARGHKAFGRALADLPLMRQTLLEMLLDVEAGLAVVLQAGVVLGRADAGSRTDQALIRILTPLAKWYLYKRARYITGEGMEVRGGNGYVEDWVNPRLVRDSHLGSIWEGSSNVILLDVARAMAKDSSHRALFADIEVRLNALADPELHDAAALVRGSLERLRLQIERLPALDDEHRDLPLDRIARRMYHLNAATLLLEEAGFQAQAGLGYRKLLLAARYLRAFVFPPGDDLGGADPTTIDWFNALVEHGQIPASVARSLLVAMG